MDGVAVVARSMVRGLCVRFEGLYRRPYLCPAGVPTIGIGSTRYEDGTRVALTDPAITEERAYQLLDFELDTVALPAARLLCPPCRTEPGMQAALADFVYNLGAARLAGSTLRKKINAGDIDGAKIELRKWTRGGGKVLPGLVLRREAEAALLDSA